MLLVPPDDHRALASAIERGLAQGEELGRTARENVRGNFTWERCGQATLAAYRSVLERR